MRSRARAGRFSPDVAFALFLFNGLGICATGLAAVGALLCPSRRLNV